MKIIFSTNISEDFIYDVQKIDRQVYLPSECASFETDRDRWLKNKDSYILLYDETSHSNKFIGYMSFFPISDELLHLMKTTDKAYDDDITPDMIKAYEGDVHIFILSIVVHADYRNGEAICKLTNAFKDFIEEKNSSKVCNIKDITALAVSDGGRKILGKLGLKKLKEVEHGYDLFHEELSN